ncbi:HalOD1 output domain-containing protein [Halosimplex amylolyticum]|uniref:HalOD1 output domain-containing protein n=1 Tax=Halosimplex amylolyticum TaxID=3396616 RepID=UPI003F570BB1
MRSSTTPGESSPDTVTCTIVQRVAATTGRSIYQLPPLYDAIDPDALEALVDSSDSGGTSLSIAFDYAGHRVTVSADGTVRIRTAERQSTTSAL